MTDRRRTKFILAGLAVFLLIVQIAAKDHAGAIRRMAAETEDPVLRKKLMGFQKEGVERKLHASDYDIEAAIAYATSLTGAPHRMGGRSPEGLDCSGLVMLAHSKVNVELPHSAQEQARYGKIIPPEDELKRGDLVFFHSTYNTSRLVTHSGIYLGDDKFIHTSSSVGVTVSDLHASPYWSEHYLFATRLLGRIETICIYFVYSRQLFVALVEIGSKTSVLW